MSDTVKVVGYVKDLLLVPKPAVEVLVQVHPFPQTKGNVIFDRATIKVLTDSTGYFEADVASQTTVTVYIPATGFKVTGTLPLSGTVNVTDIERLFPVTSL